MKLIIYLVGSGVVGGGLLAGLLHWPAFYIGLSVVVGSVSGLIIGCIIDGWLRSRQQSGP